MISLDLTSSIFLVYGFCFQRYIFCERATFLQDIAEWVELVSKPLSSSYYPPTMVTASSNSSCTGRESNCGKRQLDKAIARLQERAAAKKF